LLERWPCGGCIGRRGQGGAEVDGGGGGAEGRGERGEKGERDREVSLDR